MRKGGLPATACPAKRTSNEQKNCSRRLSTFIVVVNVSLKTCTSGNNEVSTFSHSVFIAQFCMKCTAENDELPPTVAAEEDKRVKMFTSEVDQKY